MSRRLRTFLAACAFVLAGQAVASAQARSAPPISGRPVGVDRAMGRSIDVAAGRPSRESSVADPTLPTLPNQPNRQQYEWAERARLRDLNERNAEKDLRDHPGMPPRLNTTADDLRKGYREAVFYNPTLTFGQYVAVTRLVADLGATHPNVTRVGLLNGITAGKSLERTLRDRGLGQEEAKEAVRRARQEIKESRRRD
jgi:hypothetical protein